MSGRTVLRGGSRWAWMLALLALAGCTHASRRVAPPPPHGRVSYHAVEDRDTRHYKTDKHITWSQPQQMRSNRAPAYPAALLARKLAPVTVVALLIVDPHGRVTAVRFAPGKDVDATTRAFRQAVREATSRWRFSPLQRSRWQTRADGTQVRVAMQAMPFSQRYAFRFAVHDGKPVVSSALPAAVGR